MLTVAVMVASAAAVVAAWRLVAAGRVSIWPAMSVVLGTAAAAAVAAGGFALSGRLPLVLALGAGAAAGMFLYLATAAFVIVVRRWPAFERHVEDIYDQRRGLALSTALLLAAGVTAPAEELFWRGLVQGRLARWLGSPPAAAATWAAYVLVNAASGSLPIVAGAIVAGAVWGGMALWTQGVLASLASHAVWTALMVARPPGGARAVEVAPARPPP